MALTTAARPSGARSPRRSRGRESRPPPRVSAARRESSPAVVRLRARHACHVSEPTLREWRAEIAEEVGEHLAQRLRFARELGQVTAVVDRALAETSTPMDNRLTITSDERHRRWTDAQLHIEPRPGTRHGIRGALMTHHRARRDGSECGGRSLESSRRGAQRTLLLPS